MHQYNIDVFKLSNAIHEYEFEVDKAFFESFENSLIEEGNAKINVILNKSATFIDMQFRIDGKVVLVCDRSLEPFTEKVKSEHKMLFKFGEQWEELSDEIITVPRDVQRINVGQYIYEFMSLDIPMKKLHPRFRNEGDDEGIVYTSEEDEDIENTNENDPRWDKLKGLIK